MTQNSREKLGRREAGLGCRRRIGRDATSALAGERLGRISRSLNKTNAVCCYLTDRNQANAVLGGAHRRPRKASASLFRADTEAAARFATSLPPNGAKHFLIALNIEKLCFREKYELEVFDFKQCDDFYVNIQFPSADQNNFKRRTFWLLHVGFVLF